MDNIIGVWSNLTFTPGVTGKACRESFVAVERDVVRKNVHFHANSQFLGDNQLQEWNND